MMQHVEAAKRAHLRAQEDERGRLARVRATRASIASDGIASTAEVVSGMSTHYSLAETHLSNGAARRLVGVRS